MGSFRKFDKNRGDSRGGRAFGASKFGGGRTFGGRRDDRGDGPKQMFDATCSECDRKCQVPFRPSGGNPVFCSNCFKKQDGSRPSFGTKKSFGADRGRMFGGDSGSSNGITKAQFDVLSMKLDKILSLLRSTAAFEENEFDFEEVKDKKFEGPAGASVRKVRGKKK